MAARGFSELGQFRGVAPDNFPEPLWGHGRWGRPIRGKLFRSLSMSNEKPNPPQTQAHQPGHEAEMTPRPAYEPKFPGVGRLKGKVAIVTGGDSGIGRAVAVAMAREGANVAIAYLDEHEDADETVTAIEQEGTWALKFAGDIGDEAFCRKVVEDTAKRFGRLDILVNNAAEQHETDDIAALDMQQMERTFRTNIFSMFYMVKAAMPHLKAGASIINTTSVTAYHGHGTLLD
jgi:hypothetical protein